MKLHTYGLLRNSFRPSQEIRTLRTYWRQRQDLVRSTGRHIQRMQKALTQMNIQLANVISDIGGVTGQAIVKAIRDGERDPRELAAYRDCRVEASEEEIAQALEGNWQEDQLFVLRQEQAGYEFCQKQITECDQQLAQYLAQLEDRTQGATLPEETRKGRRKKKKGNPQFNLREELFRMTGTDLTQIDGIDVVTAMTMVSDSAGVALAEETRKGRRKKKRGNSPQFDLRQLLYLMSGVDLTRVDGIDVITAMTVVAEAGYDMSPWPTADHFVSWLRLSPDNRISGDKIIGRGRTPTQNRLTQALKMAASSLKASKTYLGAQYRRFRARRGPAVAVKAMAAKLARLVYNMLRHGMEYVDRGTEFYEQQQRERRVYALAKNAAQLGFQLVPVAS